MPTIELSDRENDRLKDILDGEYRLIRHESDEGKLLDDLASNRVLLIKKNALWQFIAGALGFLIMIGVVSFQGAKAAINTGEAADVTADIKGLHRDAQIDADAIGVLRENYASNPFTANTVAWGSVSLSRENGDVEPLQAGSGNWRCERTGVGVYTLTFTGWTEEMDLDQHPIDYLTPYDPGDSNGGDHHLNLYTVERDFPRNTVTIVVKKNDNQTDDTPFSFLVIGVPRDQGTGGNEDA